MTDGSTDAGEFFEIDFQGPLTSDFIAQNLHSDSCTYVRFRFLIKKLSILSKITRVPQQYFKSLDSIITEME